jgi:hypothetical protein
MGSVLFALHFFPKNLQKQDRLKLDTGTATADGIHNKCVIFIAIRNISCSTSNSLTFEFTVAATATRLLCHLVALSSLNVHVVSTPSTMTTKLNQSKGRQFGGHSLNSFYCK